MGLGQNRNKAWSPESCQEDLAGGLSWDRTFPRFALTFRGPVLGFPGEPSSDLYPSWLAWPCSGLEGAGEIMPALPEPPRGREHPPCPALGRRQPLWGPWFPGAAQGQVGPGGPSGKWGGFWISPAPSQPRARASSCREVQGACLPPQPRLPALLGLASRAGPRLPNGFPMCFSVDKVAAFNRPSPLGDFPIGTAGAASSLGPALGSVPRAGAGRRFPAAVQVGRVQQRESFSGLALPFPEKSVWQQELPCR